MKANPDHWWHDKPADMTELDRMVWRDGAERASFAYELARRSSDSWSEELPSWPELTGLEKSHVIKALGATENRWSRCWEGRLDKSVFDSPYSPVCPFGFNLGETDAMLKRIFLDWIAEQRVKHGIEKPKRRPTPTQPVPWKWLEILDDDSKLNSTDRAIRSKALKRAKECSIKLEDSLRAIPRAYMKEYHPQLSHAMYKLRATCRTQQKRA